MTTPILTTQSATIYRVRFGGFDAADGFKRR
jgi:hypothetical protein